MADARRPAAIVARYVRDALDQLPQLYANRLSNVEFVLSRRPTRYQFQRLNRRGGWLYGLYEGIPLTRRATGYAGGDYNLIPPDKITIFWESLVRDFPDDGTLAEQVRRTVFHEIAHHFGISDEDLRRTSVE